MKYRRPKLTSTMTLKTRQQVDGARLGLTPLSQSLAVCQACCLLITVALYRALGLSVHWATGIPFFVADAAILVVWIYLYRNPGKPREWIVAETVFAFLLMLSLSHILAPAQYAATALNRPLIDPLLAAADSRLGFHVPTLADWVRARPLLNAILTRGYYTLLWQFALIIPILGLVFRDRRSLWEYLFHFHLCAIVTVVMLAAFPAQCAFQHYGFESTLDQTRFIRHFNGLRDGSMTVVNLDDLEGLISMPSFHVAGALMVTWAVRHKMALLIPLVLINCTLIAATFLSGAHYFVDIIATVMMFCASVIVYQRWVERPEIPDTAGAMPGVVDRAPAAAGHRQRLS